MTVNVVFLDLFLETDIQTYKRHTDLPRDLTDTTSVKSKSHRLHHELQQNDVIKTNYDRLKASSHHEHQQNDFIKTNSHSKFFSDQKLYVRYQ